MVNKQIYDINRSRDSYLSYYEKIVRKFIINKIIEDKTPFSISKNLDELCKSINSSLEETKIIIDNLISKDSIVPDNNDKNLINFAYPVSGHKIPHLIKLKDGREFYSMCAIDSLGCHFTFKQDIIINSKCSNTGEKIRLRLVDGRIVEGYSDEIRILTMNADRLEKWVVDCWNIMNFFRSEKDFYEYIDDMDISSEDVIPLDLEHSLERAKIRFTEG